MLKIKGTNNHFGNNQPIIDEIKNKYNMKVDTDIDYYIAEKDGFFINYFTGIISIYEYCTLDILYDLIKADLVEKVEL